MKDRDGMIYRTIVKELPSIRASNDPVCTHYILIRNRILKNRRSVDSFWFGKVVGFTEMDTHLINERARISITEVNHHNLNDQDIYAPLAYWEWRPDKSLRVIYNKVKYGYVATLAGLYADICVAEGPNHKIEPASDFFDNELGLFVS